MNACEENRSEQIRDLKEASRFLGACFQEAVLKNLMVNGEGYLIEIREIEKKIKHLEASHSES